MFRPSGLFKSNQCPDTHCNRSPCPLSHGLPQKATLPVAQQNYVSNDGGSTSSRKPTPAAPTVSVARASSASRRGSHDIPGPSTAPTSILKSNPSTSATTPVSSSAARARSTIHTTLHVDNPSGKRPVETPPLASAPPAKLPKTAPGPVRKAPPSVTSLSASGAPVLNINAANTNVPLKERQRMVTVIYETFRNLYSDIPKGPLTTTMPGQHAIAQEAEIYARSQRTTYKNNGAHTITLIKKRPKPKFLGHPSIGTQGTIEARKAEEELAKKSTVTRAQLQSARLSPEQLVQWGYLVEVPAGPGGTRVSDEGGEATCERCQTLFVVRAPRSPQEQEEMSHQCTFHWGRTYLNKVGGIREMVHKCCGAPTGAPGCVLGAHVFKDPEDFELLHARHPYSLSSSFGDSFPPRSSSSKGQPQSGELEVAALDCEMIYTTAGMSLARVSVIDGAGKSVYDKLVKLDPGVEVLDYNTRFSGVTSLDEAELDLDGVRRELRKLIGPETILVGHALENDMRALRMVHMNVVDTTVLFPHQSGHPYRRALRDLAREHLGLLIQNGGAAQGHSSLEDAIATLNLVKFWVQQNQRRQVR